MVSANNNANILTPFNWNLLSNLSNLSTEKKDVVDETMKYNEDDVSNSITCRLETAFCQNGELCDDIAIDALVFRENNHIRVKTILSFVM